VRDEKPEPFTDGVNRPLSQASKTEVIRIVVADSQDLAYEYSKAILDSELTSGEHQVS